MKPLFFILLLIFSFSQTVTCQKINLDAGEWAEKLADRSVKSNEDYNKLGLILQNADSAATFDFLEKLGQEHFAKGHYFMARYYALKANEIVSHNPPDPAFSSNRKVAIKKEVTALFESAMQQAFLTDDDYLIAFVSGNYGSAMSVFQYTSKAVMYMMNSAELFEKVQYKGEFSATVYMVLGEMLWRIREYEKCIHYSQIAIDVMPDYNYRKGNIMMCNNTIGLAFHRMGKYDSAMLYYEKALKVAADLENKEYGIAWKGIITGNIAQIYYAQGKYQEALPLFMMGYQSSKKDKYYDDAANSLQWAAKTNLVLGNKEEALSQVRESFQLLLKWPGANNYRQNAYETASEIFKSLNIDDSALYYGGKYNLLHDSLEKVIYVSSLDISKLRLNNEKNRYELQKLEREKKEQTQKRNFIIAGILLISITVLLLISRKLQQSKHKREIEHTEKLRIEAEMESAKAQLKSFTNNIIEKTQIIERLESRVNTHTMSDENKELIEELTNQTILTEEDWHKFKLLFEKMHPAFFKKIVSDFPQITPAEIRMAALTYLHLTTRQMAATLGISVNSALKAKQRLRHRLLLQTGIETEDFISRL